MTFCIAWKTDTAAFLIADSAVTSTTPDTINKFSKYTSFGERQGRIDSSEAFVYEKSYKIYSTDTTAITLSGDMETGHNFISLILIHLQSGRSPEEAINLSKSNYLDISKLPHFKIALIHYSHEPKISTLDNKATPQFVPDQDFVAFGSPPVDLDKYTSSFWEGFKISREKEHYKKNADDIFLVRMLALLQIYGVHNYTIEHGIGGAYTGIIIKESGTQFQPSICYITSGENIAFETTSMTLVNANSDHFCIVGTGDYNYTIPNSTINYETDRERLLESLNDSVNQYDSGKFDYLVLINSSRQSASIVEMLRNRHHALISIDIRDELPGTLGLIITEKLSKTNNDNFTPITTPKYAQITFTPYVPPSTEQLQLIQDTIDDIRISKIHGDDFDTYKFLIFKDKKPFEWYYGNLNSLFAFLKHFKSSEYIRIVNCASDMVELEYENGEITFPKINFDLSEILSQIPEKTRPENIYMFECTTSSGNSEYHKINIFSCKLEDATEQAHKQAEAEFGIYCTLAYVGTRFYHQAFAF